ncbi:flagellar biosynthetic protein FliO [Desulforamulus aquiferis]|uniref:Flagellar protein n=1 Tax=Desulforamulus aquiferis TaxID=1397668 RepID=A0AAW7ZH61_9FIRM|nr:flagellar biosynthetic protein FliO [Desulforamulus aquiferis]MDO7788376.1 flagellar biosynthetic protein FliO [Desulforamulus aquiferis]RYD03087.1 hypothetical protein N752_22000 [Desulforamulus aquiferis]
MDNETIWLFIRLVIVLPLVLVLAYFTIKYGLSRNKGFVSGSRHMRVVEYLPLGQKGGLAMVEIGDRYYLVAFQENNISLLKEFEQLPEPLSSPGPDTFGSFRDILNRKLK